MKHPVVWFEVMGSNGERLQAFYRDLFQWRIDTDNPMKYGMVEAARGRGIPGGVGERSRDEWPSVSFYVATESIDASLDQAKELGGEVLVPRTELPGGTILGFFRDSDGNAVGLVEDAAA